MILWVGWMVLLLHGGDCWHRHPVALRREFSWDWNAQDSFTHMAGTSAGLVVRNGGWSGLSPNRIVRHLTW